MHLQPPAKPRFALVLFCMLLVAADLAAETRPPGFIRDDAVWVGRVTITDDVTIIGATVRVEPGSTISFESPRQTASGPVIRLNSPSLSVGKRVAPARLILAGTAQRPIIVETPDGLPLGAITAGQATAGSIIADHVVFRRLGKPGPDKTTDPSILLQLTSPENDLWLGDCRFERCGPVFGELLGPGASVEIVRCTFINTIGTKSLVLIGTGTGIKVVTDNVADAGFHIDCPQVLIRDNVLIGQSAAIAVFNKGSTGITIDRNYVRCTAKKDVGRYALKCEPIQAAVTQNVLIGGTYVLETAPRTVTGNVLIGEAGLKATFNIPGLQPSLEDLTTTTHGLIENLPADAVVADNLLLGPVYWAIRISRNTANSRIENNLFDGFLQGRRVLQLDAGSDKSKGLAFSSNIVMRYRTAPIGHKLPEKTPFPGAADNVFAEVPDHVYQALAGTKDSAPGDRRFDNVAQLRFEDVLATQAAASLDDRLRSRDISVAQARKMWFDAYRLRLDSPLAGKTAPGPRSGRTESVLN